MRAPCRLIWLVVLLLQLMGFAAASNSQPPRIAMLQVRPLTVNLGAGGSEGAFQRAARRWRLGGVVVREATRQSHHVMELLPSRVPKVWGHCLTGARST